MPLILPARSFSATPVMVEQVAVWNKDYISQMPLQLRPCDSAWANGRQVGATWNIYSTWASILLAGIQYGWS